MPRPRKKKETVKNVAENINTLVVKPYLANNESTLPESFGDELRASCYDDSGTGRTSYRRNRAATSRPRDRYRNIVEGFDPFHYISGFIDIFEMVYLVNKAYWNFHSFKNIVDTKADLCNQEIELVGGNQKSRDFIKAWLDKIDIFSIQQQFYTECFRSANVFIYKLNGKFTADALKKIGKTGNAKNIPIKYIFLNGQYIRIPQALNYIYPTYYRSYTDQELQRLRNPQTKEEKQLFDDLSPEDKKLLNVKGDKSKNSPLPQPNILFQLDPDHLLPIYYKKMDYEPFSVPQVVTILDDINWKMELKKIDRAIARTMDWCVLLITMGEKDNLNPTAVAAMKTLFTNESVKRTIVADYTASAKWAIPEVDKLLGHEKYKQVNEDIREALNAVFMDSEDKFANAVVKVKVFMKSIQNIQKMFLTQFLNKEIRTVCQTIGFAQIPQASYPAYDLNDDVQYKQIFVKLAQMGFLTPEETFDAFKTGSLPQPDVSLLNQRDFKKQKDDGLYTPPPLPAGDMTGGDGRPPGSAAPKSKNTASPAGTSKAAIEDVISGKHLLIAANSYYNLKEKVKEALRKKLKIKSDFNDIQNGAVSDLTMSISLSKPQKQWLTSIDRSMTEQTPPSEEIRNEVDKLSAHFDIDREYATVIYLSRKEIEKDIKSKKK